MKLYGIDGCKDGCWVVAEGEEGSARVAFRMVKEGGLEPIFRQAGRGEAIVVIDIPIGLPDCDPRPCDQAARQVVKGRASSVFPVPCRVALSADGERASEINFRKMGKRLSKQSQAILARIREVDQLMSPKLQAHVREGHPEVTFAVLNGGRPLKHAKKSREGEGERLRLLRNAGIEIDPHKERKPLGRNVGPDDIIDAAACLATAKRLAAGTAAPLPPPTDRKGLRMEIVA